MKKIITTLTFIFLFSGALFAQVNQLSAKGGEIKFDIETWDMGTISVPLDSSLTHNFSFTNIGNEPLTIKKCEGTDKNTTALWPKKSIPPRQTGIIQVFCTAGHIGNINKEVTVISNSKTGNKYIVIKGKVEDADLRELRFIEETNLKELKVDNDNWNAGTVSMHLDSFITHDFNFINAGKTPIVIDTCQSKFGHSTISWPRNPILPGEGSVIHIIYKAGYPGYFSEEVRVTFNARKSVKTITLQGEVENIDAGEIKFDEETFDFGSIPQNKPVTHEFRFTNTGKQPIVISNCQSSCGCVVPKWPKEPIMPGKSGVIQVTYSAAHAGEFNKSVTVGSNARVYSKVIFIKGNVVPAPIEQTSPQQSPSPVIIQPK